MRKLLLGIWMLGASGCATAPPTSGEALCDGSRADRARLAAALALTQDAAVLEAGSDLIDGIDAGCAA